MEEVTFARPAKVDIGWWVAALLVVGVLSGWWMMALRAQLHIRLDFDDAFMFYRYAMHVREGLGVSWNPDGVHTYGQTAPLWCGVVVLLSFIPRTMSEVLLLGSALCSVGAMLAMAWAVASNAQSKWMRRIAVVFPLVAFPMIRSGMFYGNATNGMETMLAVLLCAVYVGAVLGWQRGAVRAEVVAAVGFLMFLTRPEAALVVVVLPVAVHLLLPGTARRSVAMLVGMFLAAMLLEMLVCRWYFGAALPLSFYMKSRHAYVGYMGNWHPVNSLYRFAMEFRWYAVVLAVCVRRAEWRLVTACLVPFAMVSVYLLTVTQIMGFGSRYEMPYLALLVVPALLVLDARVAEMWGRRRNPTHDDKTVMNGAPRDSWSMQWTQRKVLAHVVAGTVVLLCVAGAVPAGFARVLDRKLFAGAVRYDPVTLNTAGSKTLPEVPYLEAMWAVTDTLIAPLPPGATIAAGEVGYLGAHAPRATIIDIAGLNDTQIALHGFSMTELLARKPDVIWMPHPDYTYQRGVMLSDPQLLAQYDVYANAADYGLAVRKESPYRAQILQQMQALWSRLYPGLQMQDDLVRSAQWSGLGHKV